MQPPQRCRTTTGTTKPQKGCGANRLINPYFIDSRVRRSFLCGSAISLLATGDSEGGRVGASAAAWNAAPLAGGRVGSTSTADPMERPASMRTAMVGSAYVHTRTCLRHRFRQARRACLGCARRSSQPTTTPCASVVYLCVRDRKTPSGCGADIGLFIFYPYIDSEREGRFSASAR